MSVYTPFVNCWLGVGLVILLSACSPLQTRALQSDPSIETRPKTHTLNAPFVKQRRRHCGPATLSMLMQFHGRDALQTDIADAVFDDTQLGTFQTDMVAYLRSQSFLPYELAPQLTDVIHAVADGYPVIVMQNLGFNGVGGVLAKWHYALVVGYDLEQQEMMLHSGPYEYYRLPFKTFERTWARSGYWGLVAWPAEQMPEIQQHTWLEPIQYLNALIDVDALGVLPSPVQAYAEFVASHPNFPRAWFRLGNHQYPKNKSASLNSFAQAVRFATTVEPRHWNNLAFVAHEQGCGALASMAVACALGAQPDFPPAIETQKAIEGAQGVSSYSTLSSNAPLDYAHCPKVTCMHAQKTPLKSVISLQ